MNQIKQIVTLISYENQKIWHQKKYQLLSGIVLVIILIGAIQLKTMNYPYIVLSMMNYFFIPISIFMLSADLITNEVVMKEIKMLITKPIAREKILFAKVMAINSYIGVLLLVSLIISTIGTLVTTELATVSMIGILGSYLVGFIPMLTVTALATLVSVVTRSSSASIALNLIIVVGSMVLSMFFSAIAPLMFTSYLGIGRLVMGSVIPVTSLVTSLLLLIGYHLIFLSAATYCFSIKQF